MRRDRHFSTSGLFLITLTQKRHLYLSYLTRYLEYKRIHERIEMEKQNRAIYTSENKSRPK